MLDTCLMLFIVVAIGMICVGTTLLQVREPHRCAEKSEKFTNSSPRLFLLDGENIWGIQYVFEFEDEAF